MKLNSLQLRKALSAALFVLLLSVVGTKNALAQNQVAVLQHNDTLSAFYGPNALSLAHETAVDGDTITLSSGNFNGCNLSKAVTIHGAGCYEDVVNHRPPTCINTISLSKSDGTIPLTIEGIWLGKVDYPWNVTNRNVRFIKCNIDDHSCYYDGSRRDLYFDNCKIMVFKGHGASGIIIQNSVVRFVSYEPIDQNYNNLIYNSVVCFNDNVTLENTRVFNTILATAIGNTAPNSTFYNCIEIQTGDSNIFEGQLNESNMQVNSYEEVFRTFDGTVDYNESYLLKSSIANTFLGDDGTEVGIHGGMNPYNARPSYMIIRNTNVAGRTTEDDRLNVEIELIQGN